MPRKKDRQALAAERAANRGKDTAEARQRHDESVVLRLDRELQEEVVEPESTS